MKCVCVCLTQQDEHSFFHFTMFDSFTNIPFSFQLLVTFLLQTGSRSHEEIYLKRWFDLVNKKNALLRRQMQLNLL